MHATPNEQTSLIIKRLPLELEDKEITGFLTSLGAFKVQVLPKKENFKKCAIADFPSEDAAYRVLQGLHQRKLLNCRVCVEYYVKERISERYIPNANASELRSNYDVAGFNNANTISGGYPQAPSWLQELTSVIPGWSTTANEEPLKLYYSYPSVTNNILTNIVRALSSCTTLYTQVLHLMNRLNLPPPFGDTELYPGDLCVVPQSCIDMSSSALQHSLDSKASNLDDEEEMDLSSGLESELESDEASTLVGSSVVRSTIDRRRKRAKRLVAKPIPSSAKKSKPLPTPVTAVFEQTEKGGRQHLIQIPQHLGAVTPGERADDATITTTEGGFGVFKPTVVTPNKMCPSEGIISTEHIDEECHETLEPSTDTSVPSLQEKQSLLSHARCLSRQELKDGQLSQEKKEDHSIFSRGYTPGVQTSRLYVKNLAPSVKVFDLLRVFGSFAETTCKNSPTVDELAGDPAFSVRLLTEGRMKGQAFVSLASEVVAQEALEATNGYVLNGRPMVVQFARGAKAKVDVKSLINET